MVNLGSESETCVGSRVRLVGVSISFGKNFYRLPFTPPLWFAVSVLHPGFPPGYLTLKIRSTELTFVKLRSTWAITSKTSPTIPNYTPWSTSGQGLVKNLVKPLEHPLTLLCRRNFCRVLQISPKHFKFSQCKSCVLCRGTQLSC
jgi:hypothetical protein